ncbi:archaetidylserine decarboxylase [Francisella adeliensis]|uniref:Phosphatidylserine decarboxylase proenzyme n=1 Tax=Francisella adeliensis TaxID=2007306 RepID=A0A2Z4XWS9_9GAMM|nr:archaetidylserine decarboxylase [Francisella adeliensis]AXA33334.1 phosphatidylserine decarboxylase [Francisella adeliensis]MBK2085344.1 phosphatidylserine decarboxylase [Francisella adeliensis]MBK2097074.1 phosphatidylserine decarboxylase [Francisella adeliensis]QIW12931.1 phosphatidylserine decarboxylase [Francisella adeliensis]QIW13437.1 phosphatidylserine decarboxylase [Francisella adeliensis]
MKDDLFIYFQYMIPQAVTSRLVSKLAESRNKALKNYLIKLAIKKFNINIEEAKSSNLDDYASFNEFFIRELKDGLRPLNIDSNTISSPADGVLSEFGKIENNTLIQAKGKDFSLESLVAGSSETKFTDFATVYLSPRDYHRVHMPIDGKLTKMVYIPGKLFSVNKTTANNINSLFAKNERLVCYFETAIGEVAVIFVGALLVAGIETKWHGKIAPNYYNRVQEWSYDCDKFQLDYKKGEEIGLFNFGSTVIFLAPNNKIKFQFDEKDSVVQVNQDLALIVE